jgi:hypothetical protein
MRKQFVACCVVVCALKTFAVSAEPRAPRSCGKRPPSGAHLRIVLSDRSRTAVPVSAATTPTISWIRKRVGA